MSFGTGYMFNLVSGFWIHSDDIFLQGGETEGYGLIYILLVTLLL